MHFSAKMQSSMNILVSLKYNAMYINTMQWIVSKPNFGQSLRKMIAGKTGFPRLRRPQQQEQDQEQQEVSKHFVAN